VALTLHYLPQPLRHPGQALAKDIGPSNGLAVFLYQFCSFLSRPPTMT